MSEKNERQENEEAQLHEPSRQELREVLRASRDVVADAEHTLHEAVEGVDHMLSSLETGPITVPGDDDTPRATLENPDPNLPPSKQMLDEMRRLGLLDSGPPRTDRGPHDEEWEGHTSARPGQTGTGPNAQATGHGLMRMGPRQPSRPAFEAFMIALREPLRRSGASVTEITGWVKIQGRQGHKIYIAKTVTGVSRIESTLDPRLIPGARPPDQGRRNGRIASWIPARSEAVAAAIELLGSLEDPPPAPRRTDQ